MTASAGIKTHGTKIAIGDGASPEAFTTLGEGISIGEYGETLSTIDFSNHDTPVGPKDYKLADLAEGSEISLSANYVEADAGRLAFLAAKEARLAKNFRITKTNTKTITFSGLILSWKEIATDLDGKMTCSFGVKINSVIGRT